MPWFPNDHEDEANDLVDGLPHTAYKRAKYVDPKTICTGLFGEANRIIGRIQSLEFSLPYHHD
jgi:hypothetical protein